MDPFTSRFDTQPPFCFFWVFSFGPFWSVTRKGLVSSPSRRSLACLVAACTHNACVTIAGGRQPRQLPPPNRIITTNVLRPPRILGEGRQKKVAPLEMAPRAVCTSPLRPAVPQSVARKTEVGKQLYCHTNAVDSRASSNPVVPSSRSLC